MPLVGVPYDGHVLRYAQPVLLYHLHGRKGQCVVHGQDGVRRVWECKQHFRGSLPLLVAYPAAHYQFPFYGYAALAQGFQVAAFPALDYLQVVGTPDEGYPPAPVVQQMPSGPPCRHLTVGHHRGEDLGQAYTIEEHDGHVDVGQGCEMPEVGSLLRQAGDDALHTHAGQVLQVALLVFEGLVRCGDDDKIAVCHGHILYAAQYGGKEVGDDVRNYHPDDACGIVAQAHGKGIGTIVHLLGQLLGLGAQFGAYLRAVLQGSGYRGDGHSQHSGEVLQRCMLLLFHCCCGAILPVSYCKERHFQANLHTSWGKKPRKPLRSIRPQPQGHHSRATLGSCHRHTWQWR